MEGGVSEQELPPRLLEIAQRIHEGPMCDPLATRDDIYHDLVAEYLIAHNNQSHPVRAAENAVRAKYLSKTGEQRTVPLGETSDPESNVEREVMRELTREEVHKYFVTLPNDEKILMVYIYGLDGGEERTIKMASVMAGIPYTRALELHRKALRRLGHGAGGGKLIEYIRD